MRANALTEKDKAAYESACHLTEGYAHYNEVKVREEILETNRLAAGSSNGPLRNRKFNWNPAGAVKGCTAAAAKAWTI